MNSGHHATRCFVEVKGKGMPAVYFYAQNIKTGEYVNCFLEIPEKVRKSLITAIIKRLHRLFLTPLYPPLR